MSWEGLNRRRFPRVKFPCLIKLIRDGETPEAILTHTENISSGGVGVIVRKHFDIFTPLGVEIDLLDTDDLIRCRGKVVWTVRRKAAETVKPTFYDVGIEFVELRNVDHSRIIRTIEQLNAALQKVKLG